MHVTSVQRTRHLVIRVDRGEEIPSALIRALDEAEARAAWITGIGAVEAAEIALHDAEGRDEGVTRKIDAPCGVVSLTGNAALADGALSLRLSTTLGRETELGPMTLSGQLLWARAASLELHVVVFDDVTLVRSADDRTGQPMLTARGAGAPRLAEPPRGEQQRGEQHRSEQQRVEQHRGEQHRGEQHRGEQHRGEQHRNEQYRGEQHRGEPHRAAQHRAAEPAAAQAQPQQYPPQTAAADPPAMPQKPVRREEEVDAYPEVGDAVTHFHFGECTVISSDGDRIRLRQDRDGRVREVALAMLKIESPTMVDGKRHFKLTRKN